MTDLQRCLDTLRNERERLQAYVDVCECVVQCWIRKLPDEMLSCIFEEYAAMEDEEAGKELASAAHMEPQYLAKKHLLELSKVRLVHFLHYTALTFCGCKVCSRWHRLIIGTPSLWSYVVANPNLWPSGTGETCLSLLSASLARSKSHPLSFDSMIIAPLSLRICGDVLRLLTEHAERWRSVSLFLDGETYPLLRDIKPLAQLRALTLRTADGPTPGFAAVPPADADLQTFTNAPNLRSLTLQGHPRNLPPLPWEQVTELDSFFIARAGTDLHAGLLSYLPLERLPEEAVLGLTGHPMVAPNADPPPSTPKLCQAGSVDIELSSDRPLNQATARLAVEEILDSLVFPKAHTMSFFPRDRDPLLPWNAAAFLSLARRSGFAQRLMSLSLFVEITTKELVELLSAVPKLEELYITDAVPGPVDDAGDAAREREPLITDELLKALTLSPRKQQKDESASVADVDAGVDADLTFAAAVAKIPQGHGLVPNLWTLGLTTRLAFSDDALYDFADSREGERFRRNGKYLNARRALRHSAESDSKDASKKSLSESLSPDDGYGNFLLEIHRLSCAKRTLDDAFLERMRGVELDGCFVMEVCDALESEEHVSSGSV
ncbi:F-box domain-containing protein [Mycena chlorophos]|uniref:F-box domain-containing protein n=1 Tax=Mycena chlorophos TaxID=658473 RepID=A0A8H6TH35_MYCCL|nr:F-box domain-containing protein [Mycena chlorophos]